MVIKRLPRKIPKKFQRFFWDTDATKVNPSKTPFYVINRLLDKGDLAAARWVLHNFPKETIIETFKKMRDFSPWNGVFWSRFLGIPREGMACLDQHYLTLRRLHWPY